MCQSSLRQVSKATLTQTRTVLVCVREVTPRPSRPDPHHALHPVPAREEDWRTHRSKSTREPPKSVSNLPYPVPPGRPTRLSHCQSRPVRRTHRTPRPRAEPLTTSPRRSVRARVLGGSSAQISSPECVKSFRSTNKISAESRLSPR